MTHLGCRQREGDIVETLRPHKAPEAAEWLATDEQLRIDAVASYHRRKGIRLPNATLHALFHTIVENQLALGEAAVIETLARLQEEGLDRHDSTHAIGSILSGQVHGILAGTMQGSKEHVTEDYLARLKVLTAESWRRSG